MRPALFLLLIVFLGACAQEKTLDYYLAESEAYIEIGDYPAARIELRNAMQIDSNSAAARYMLGKIHFYTDDNIDAEKELIRAETYGWPADETRPMLAKVLLNQSKFTQVLELEVEDLQPVPAGKLLAVQVLAALLTEEAEMGQALFDRAMEKAPEDFDVRLLGARMASLEVGVDEGLEQSAVLLKEDPQNPNVLRLRAQLLMRQERLEEARDAVGETIEYVSTDFTDRVVRATINVQLGQFDAVSEDLDNMVALDPDDPSANYIAGLMAFQEGRTRDTIAYLDDALPIESKFPIILFYLGLSHLLDGDPSLAQKYANAFVERVPNSIQGRKFLALMLLQNKRYDEVEALLQPVRDFNPNDIGALNMVAHALLQMDRGDESLFLFRWLGRLLPDENIAELPFTQGLVTSSLDAHREAEIQAVLVAPEPFPRAEILEISRLLAAQDYEAAVVAADSLKWRETSGIAPYKVLADAHMLAGQEGKAREVLELALKRDPGNATVNLKLAHLASENKRLKAERAYYGAVLTKDPANLPVLLSLAILEGNEGDNYAMESTLREAADLNPQALEPRLGLARYYIDSGTPDRVIPLFSNLLKLQQRSPRVMASLAVAHMAQGNHDSAYQALSEMTLTIGGNSGQFHMLAMAASALGKDEEAAAALAKALELNPGNLTLLLASAREREMAGDIDGMAPYVEKLAELSPEAAEVQRLRAVMAAYASDVGGALALSQKAHQDSPSTATALQLAELQRQSGKPDRARQTLTGWLDNNPEDVPAMLSLSDQLYAGGDEAAAEQQYVKALTIDPDNVLALNNLAWMLREKKPARALKYIRRASELMPEEPMVLDSRAVIEHLNGKNVQAGLVIQQALDADPGNPS
ncbi:MAG: putative PEP-CTERM system TPR-repeat lipoprotein, partial [Bacteroidia bacterium]